MGNFQKLIAQAGRKLIDWEVEIPNSFLAAPTASSVLAIPAPGPGKVVVPDWQAIFARFKAGTLLFSEDGAINGFWGTDEDSPVTNLGDITTALTLSGTDDCFAVGITQDALVGLIADIEGLGFFIGVDANTSGFGGIKTFSLVTGGNNGINTFSLGTNKGLLYAVGDLIIDVAGDANAIFSVTSIGAGGTVTGLQELFSGSGYSISTNDATNTNGSGSGFQLNVLTIGGGFRVGDIAVDDAQGNSPAASFRVDAVDANGNATQITLSNPGSGYVVQDGDILNGALGDGQTGFGSGATINVNSILPGNGSIRVTIPFRVITL